jgi:hypothetical protein
MLLSIFHNEIPLPEAITPERGCDERKQYEFYHFRITGIKIVMIQTTVTASNIM